MAIVEDASSIVHYLNIANDGRISLDTDSAARIMKIGEEFGEAVEAWITWTGQNPRKIDRDTFGESVTFNFERMLDELADVVMTATCAIVFFIGSSEETDSLLRRRGRDLRKRAVHFNEETT